MKQIKRNQLPVRLGFALIAGAATLLSTHTPALSCADGVACAVVRQTSDGFVALRREETASSALLTKLRPYEIVVIYVDSCDPTPSWTLVESVPRLDGMYDGNRRDLTSGFVSTKLLEDAECPIPPE